MPLPAKGTGGGRQSHTLPATASQGTPTQQEKERK